MQILFRLKAHITQKVSLEPIKWTLDLVNSHLQDPIIPIRTIEGSDLTIGIDLDTDIQIDHRFYERLQRKEFAHAHHFSDELLIRTEDGKPDFLSTIFYLVNSLQEYHPTDRDLDKYDRFKFTSSVQHKFAIIEKNYVFELIQRFLNSHSKLTKLKRKQMEQSAVCLSHDIDFLYSAYKTESIWAVKNFRPKDLLNIWKATLGGSPPYFNIREMIDLHAGFGFKSTYNWIVQNGRSSDGIKNSDYSVDSEKVKQAWEDVHVAGNENGLHKSTMAASIQEELKLCPSAVISNRYHFLRFQLPRAYDEISQSDLRCDTSLGFAEHIGFRNSYGMPFRPFDLEKNRSYDFVAVPLHVMDASLLYYMNLKPGEIAQRVINFISQNRDHSIISLLWHNNELSNYKYRPMAEAYHEILSYLIDEGFTSLLPSELAEIYSV